MEDILTNVEIMVKNIKTGNIYKARYVVERPAGCYGMVWAWIQINTEHGIFLESYKPTVLEAIDRLREKPILNWERA